MCRMVMLHFGRGYTCRMACAKTLGAAEPTLLSGDLFAGTARTDLESLRACAAANKSSMTRTPVVDSLTWLKCFFLNLCSLGSWTRCAKREAKVSIAA